MEYVFLWSGCFFLGNMVVYWSTMLLVNYLDAVYENCIEKMACHTLTECLLGRFIQSPMPGYYGICFLSLPHHSQNSSISLSKWHNFEAFIGVAIIFGDYPISRKALSVCKPWLLSFQELSVYQQTEGQGCLENLTFRHCFWCSISYLTRFPPEQPSIL